jgi:hypothetical protein
LFCRVLSPQEITRGFVGGGALQVSTVSPEYRILGLGLSRVGKRRRRASSGMKSGQTQKRRAASRRFLFVGNRRTPFHNAAIVKALKKSRGVNLYGAGAKQIVT